MRIENKEGPITVLRINGIVIFFTFMTFLAGSFARECECYDWRTRHPEWIWCDDFETEKNLHTNYQDVSSNGLRVSDTDAFEGSYALEQRYDSGQVDAGWISWFYDSALGKSYGKSYDEIYVRWYHKFERGFTGVPPKMARIRSLGPEWEKRFSVHYWVESGSPNKEIVADVHVPYSSQANSLGWLPIARSNFYYNNPDNIGRWVCHEMYVKKNTPGKADGAYRFWADNTPIVERTNVDLVGSTNYEFNCIMLDCYWNGGSPRTQNRYYDNFVISTRRIGPLASLAIQTIPSPPARYAVFRKDFNKPSGIFDIRGRRIAAANTWLTRAGMQKSSEAGLAADGVYLIVRKGNAYPLGEWQR